MDPILGAAPAALTIAGSDSGGGAGIQADLLTFGALGVFGTCAVTALTAQDSSHVHGVLLVDPDFVALQVRTVLADFAPKAAKTGMLGDEAVVAAVAEVLTEASPRPALVVDPVLVAKGGAALLPPSGAAALRTRLLPLATLAAPNLPEAAVLLGQDELAAPAWSRARREDVARRLLDLGPAAVLLKGGHATEDRARGVAADLLATPQGLEWLEAAWVPTPHVHGTGCTLSAAITAGLALGRPLGQAVADARRFLEQALLHAWTAGRGRGCPRASWRLAAADR